MTQPETDLLTLAQLLQEERCHCGKVPACDYEPGSIRITCHACGISFTAPDLDIPAALDGWREKTN